jgi:hypothetical protein
MRALSLEVVGTVAAVLVPTATAAEDVDVLLMVVARKVRGTDDHLVVAVDVADLDGKTFPLGRHENERTRLSKR